MNSKIDIFYIIGSVVVVPFLVVSTLEEGLGHDMSYPKEPEVPTNQWLDSSMLPLVFYRELLCVSCCPLIMI